MKWAQSTLEQQYSGSQQTSHRNGKDKSLLPRRLNFPTENSWCLSNTYWALSTLLTICRTQEYSSQNALLKKKSLLANKCVFLLFLLSQLQVKWKGNGSNFSDWSSKLILQFLTFQGSSALQGRLALPVESKWQKLWFWAYVDLWQRRVSLIGKLENNTGKDMGICYETRMINMRSMSANI